MSNKNGINFGRFDIKTAVILFELKFVFIIRKIKETTNIKKFV